jgi:hypothetical protein
VVPTGNEALAFCFLLGDAKRKNKPQGALEQGSGGTNKSNKITVTFLAVALLLTEESLFLAFWGCYFTVN